MCFMKIHKYELKYTNNYRFRLITFGQLFSGHIKGIKPEMNVYLSPIQECMFSIKDTNIYPQPQLF